VITIGIFKKISEEIKTMLSNLKKCISVIGKVNGTVVPLLVPVIKGAFEAKDLVSTTFNNKTSNIYVGGLSLSEQAKNKLLNVDDNDSSDNNNNYIKF